jgi:ABC-type uncharacterized transport system substrate-binding protein
LQLQGQQAATQAAQAATQATAVGKQFSTAVADILKGQKPVGCGPSMKYLVDGIPELKWEKK